MPQPYNPFVPYLNRYTTVSPEHEAAFDEFISQVDPPGKKLRLETKTEQFVITCFDRRPPPSVILTGNAGDGKTYLCRQIIERFTRQPVVSWVDQVDWPIEHGGYTLRVIKDLSEVGETTGANILEELALVQREPRSGTSFLIAANEGRLRAILAQEQLRDLKDEVDRQLREGPDLTNDRLIILNLNQITTSTYVPQTIEWITQRDHWDACQGCAAVDVCPIRWNAVRLSNTNVVQQLTHLYQILEHLGTHVTIRDMLIHLTYTVTGGLDCDTVVSRSRRIAWDAHRHVYYENIWGEGADTTFHRKVGVIRYLRRLNVGNSSVFEIDDFIVNSWPDSDAAQTEHDALFAPALDMDGRRFAQERRAYLSGGSASPRPDDEHPLIAWLPHCRRKLFFEWQNEAVNRLFPFRYLPDYFRLLTGDRAMLERYRSDVILGLNRAFSGLYLTDADHLYITSQYAHAVEQPVPIVRAKIATDYIDLRPHALTTAAFDRDLTTLVLEIPPPPRIDTAPVRWAIDLLRFEYLMWRARGGTANVLAAECELLIRNLKDELLSRFAAEDLDSSQIVFFAADRHRYTLQTLWIDEAGHMHI